MQTGERTMTTKNEKPTETSSVAYIGWSVEKRNGKNFWTRVGVAFKPHEDGKGFTTRFAAGIAADGDPGCEPRGEALAVLVRFEGHADAGPEVLSVSLFDAPADVGDRAGFGGFFVFRCHGSFSCLHYPFGRCLRRATGSRPR